MPFESDEQRRFMFWKHPRIANRWTSEEKAKARREKRAPQYVKKRDMPRYGEQAGIGTRMPDDEFAKAYRTYDPEAVRQRNMGALAAGGVLAGGLTGGHAIYSQRAGKEGIREATKLIPGIPKRHYVIGGRNAAKLAAAAAMLGGGAAAARYGTSRRGNQWE